MLRWPSPASFQCPDLSGAVFKTSETPVEYGGFSDVFIGEWRSPGGSHGQPKCKAVAIKVLRGIHTKDRKKIDKRLHREVLIWHRLVHPNITRLYGLCSDFGTLPAMISPWHHHGSISRYLQTNPIADRVKLVKDVAAGLAYMHSFSPPVVHGDLKGANILITEDLRASITDFGLSRVLQDAAEHSNFTTSAPAGSVRWMAPELLFDEDEAGDPPKVTSASDVYACGSVALEIMTSKRPYHNVRSDLSVMKQILRHVTPLRPNNSDLTEPISEALWDLIQCCWHPLSEERPNMSIVLGKLDKIPSAQSRVFFGAMRRSHDGDREEMVDVSLGSRLSAQAGWGRHGADQRTLKPPLHIDGQDGGGRRSFGDGDSTLCDVVAGLDSDDTLVELRLRPADHGMHAYAYLASAFTIELVVWSFPFSYGVFFAHSVSPTSSASAPSPFSSVSNSYLLPLTGALSIGLTYLISPHTLPFISRYPNHYRSFIVLGASLCIGSLVGAAFSRETWHFLVAQGLAYPMGASILYRPATSYLPEWFSTRRAMASSVMYCATGLGGIVVPFVTDELLHTYGHRVTFITLAIAFTLLIAPTLPFIGPRLPPSKMISPPSLSKPYLFKSSFWILICMNSLQGLASFLPFIYLPAFAASLGINHTLATLGLVVMQVSSALGLLSLSWSSEHFSLRLTILFSTLGSAISVLLLWGFATHIVTILAFAATFGFCAGGFSGLWSRLIGLVIGNDQRLSGQMLTIFAATRGVGTILSAPISSALLRVSGLSGAKRFGLAYASDGYGPLILFTALALLISAAGTMWDHFDNSDASESDDTPKKAEVEMSTQMPSQHAMVYLPRPSAVLLKNSKLA